MNDNDEIVLKDLDAKVAAQTLNGTVAFTKAQKGTFGTNTDLIMNSNSELVLVTKESADTTVGYKNININETGVNALVIYDGRVIESIVVVDGEVISDDIYAYYNGEKYNTTKGTWVTLYIDGEATSYLYADAANLAKGAYIVDVEGEELVAVKNVGEAEAVVAAAKTLYFTVGQNNLYYAEDVKVYDITDGGAEASVAKNDKVVYVVDQSSKNTGLITHIYITGEVTTVVNPDAVETVAKVDVVATAGTATITVSDKEAVVKVTAMKKVDGEYVVFDQNATVVMADGVGTYNPTELAGNGNYVLKVTVNGLNAGTWGPFYLTPAPVVAE